MTTVAIDTSHSDVIVRPMLTTDRAIDLFLGDLTRRGYSERTRTTYSRILDRLAERLPTDQDIAKVSPDDCRRFLDLYNHRAAGTRAHTFSVLSSFFSWLYLNEKIGRNPLDRVERPRRIPAQDLDVTTVSADDVQRLMMFAETWPEKLAVAILVYMGPRRRAAARLRLSDYDRARGRLRFREKGGKVIWKPIPSELDQLIEAAIAAGVYQDQDYLIPAEGYLQRKGDRDDRVVWRLVKKVAKRAGVITHVHALRAAFAVGYLERNPGDIEALKEILGHRSVATTQVYLRKLDKETAMERVRSMSWGVAMTGAQAEFGSPQIADKPLAVPFGVGAGGFEPPFADDPGISQSKPPTSVGEAP